MILNKSKALVQTFPHIFGQGGAADTAVLNTDLESLAQAISDIHVIQSGGTGGVRAFTEVVGGAAGVAPGASSNTSPGVIDLFGTSDLTLDVPSQQVISSAPASAFYVAIGSFTAAKSGGGAFTGPNGVGDTSTNTFFLAVPLMPGGVVTQGVGTAGFAFEGSSGSGVPTKVYNVGTDTLDISVTWYVIRLT